MKLTIDENGYETRDLMEIIGTKEPTRKKKVRG